MWTGSGARRAVGAESIRAGRWEGCSSTTWTGSGARAGCSRVQPGSQAGQGARAGTSDLVAVAAGGWRGAGAPRGRKGGGVLEHYVDGFSDRGVGRPFLPSHAPSLFPALLFPSSSPASGSTLPPSSPGPQASGTALPAPAPASPPNGGVLRPPPPRTGSTSPPSSRGPPVLGIPSSPMPA